MQGETRGVRDEERLDVDALARYLAGKGLRRGRDVRVEQFPGGHSNLTYLVRAGDEEWVLRRPPLGVLAPKAHDMMREARVLAAVSPSFAPAPRPVALCDDPAVLGAPFFLMERRRGFVIRRQNPPEIGDDLDLRRRVGEAFLDTLVELHSLDVSRPPLQEIGRPAGFLERQVSGWTQRWQRAKTQESPAMEELMAWLSARCPAPQAAALLHNDYKLDNVMWHAADPARVAAVLDWEMSTLGDPLVDLGILLCYWPEAGDPPARRESISPVTTLSGWPTRAQLTQRYAFGTGLDLAGIAYYEIFAISKVAVVLQQIYHRYRMGQTTDERFAVLGDRVMGLIDVAADLKNKGRL